WRPSWGRLPGELEDAPVDVPHELGIQSELPGATRRARHHRRFATEIERREVNAVLQPLRLEGESSASCEQPEDARVHPVQPGPELDQLRRSPAGGAGPGLCLGHGSCPEHMSGGARTETCTPERKRPPRHGSLPSSLDDGETISPRTRQLRRLPVGMRRVNRAVGAWWCMERGSLGEGLRSSLRPARRPDSCAGHCPASSSSTITTPSCRWVLRLTAPSWYS